MHGQSAQVMHALDEHTASRIVRRINELRWYAGRVEEWAGAEIRKAQMQEERLMQRFRPQLEAWARQRLGQGRRRSIALPGGTLGFRRQPVRPVLVDQQEVLSWCRGHLPEALRLRVVAEGVVPSTSAMCLSRWGRKLTFGRRSRNRCCKRFSGLRTSVRPAKPGPVVTRRSTSGRPGASRARVSDLCVRS